MSGHFDEEASGTCGVELGAYDPARCEHGALLAFGCALCPQPHDAELEPRKIQIGPLDV